MKCKQPNPEFEVGSPYPFPAMTITVTSQAPSLTIFKCVPINERYGIHPLILNSLKSVIKQIDCS